MTHLTVTICRARVRAEAPRRRGMSLVEAALAMLMLSVIAVAGARTVATARAADQLAVDREQARQLAESMLARVMLLSYEDPTPGLLGLDLGETLGLESSYDDLDDYHGHVENPVKDSAGAAIAGLSAWSREVRVTWVKPDDLTATRASETGVKRVLVIVKKSGRKILEANAYRSKSRDRMER
ncbi:MAG: hypothetical protein AB7K52_09600 [Phycisphaerales bacterium]